MDQPTPFRFGPEPTKGELVRSEPLRTSIERAWPTMDSLTRKISALMIDALARELVAWDDLRHRLDDDSDLESIVVWLIDVGADLRWMGRMPRR